MSVTRLTSFPEGSDDPENDDTMDSVYLPSDDSDASDGGESELWAPDGTIRPDVRGTLSFPAFVEDNELSHVCIGVDIGTVVHEVSYLLHTPTEDAASALGSGGGSGGGTRVITDTSFDSKKFGFHLHASLCVERHEMDRPNRRPSRGGIHHDDGAGGGGGGRRSSKSKPSLSSPDNKQRGKLVRIDDVFGVEFDDSSSSSNGNGGVGGGGGGGGQGRGRGSERSLTPADLHMLPFNKRALLENTRTDFPADNPVRLWMATYSHHDPRDAFVRACQELSRVARDYLVRYVSVYNVHSSLWIPPPPPWCSSSFWHVHSWSAVTEGLLLKRTVLGL